MTVQNISDQKRKDAVRALINLCLLEGFVLIAVVAVYLYTSNLTYLIGGVIGTMLIFGPMFMRWIKTHGDAIRSEKKSVEENRP